MVSEKAVETVFEAVEFAAVGEEVASEAVVEAVFAAAVELASAFPPDIGVEMSLTSFSDSSFDKLSNTEAYLSYWESLLDLSSQHYHQILQSAGMNGTRQVLPC